MMEITKEKISEYAAKYNQRYNGTEDSFAESEIKEWLKNNHYLDKQKFVRIGLWKSKRPKKKYESNNETLIKEITKFSFNTLNEEARIKSIMILNGVSYPVASTILHFAFPNKYPIMDFRALWSLGWDQPKSYNFDFWQKYCEKIRQISKDVSEDIRTVDKALWQYSKENQKNK